MSAFAVKDMALLRTALNMMGLEEKSSKVPFPMDSVKTPLLPEPKFLGRVQEYLKDTGSVYVGAQARGATALLVILDSPQ